MDELGHVLREARETKGLTLAEVEAQTRINRRFLEALEKGEYHLLPTPVHGRGFLRNYARFLHLDPAPLLERFELIKQHQLEDALPAAEPTVLIPEPEMLRQSQPFFDPVNFQVDDGRRRDPLSLVRLLIIVALLVFLGLVVNRFFPLLTAGQDGTESLTEGINQVWRELTNGSAAEDGDRVLLGEDLLTPTPDIIFNTESNNFLTAVPTPLPTRPSLGTLEIINLRLEISERTWMEVTIDGSTRFSGFATRGDVFEWTANDSVRLVTGNARGIIATINGIELGRLGGFQEAREENWSTTR